MNKIYKLVWSKVRNMWVVASEFAKSHSKSHSSVIGKKPLHVGLLVALVSGSVMTVGVQTVWAEPTVLTDEQKNEIADKVLEKLNNNENLSKKIQDEVFKYKNKLVFAGGVIGKQKSPSDTPMAFGNGAFANGYDGISLGYQADAFSPKAVSIGARASTLYNGDIAVGNQTHVAGLSAALGSGTELYANQSVALGTQIKIIDPEVFEIYEKYNYTNPDNKGAVDVPSWYWRKQIIKNTPEIQDFKKRYARLLGTLDEDGLDPTYHDELYKQKLIETILWEKTTKKIQKVTAVGFQSGAKVTGGVALGAFSNATRKGEVIGYNPNGEQYKDVADFLVRNNKKEAYVEALREQETLEREVSNLETQRKSLSGERYREISEKAYEKNKESKKASKKVNDLYNAWVSIQGAVAVGNEETGMTRQITGVSAGSEDTDAVNVAQLKAANYKIDKNTEHVTNLIEKVEKGGVKYFSVNPKTENLPTANISSDNAANDGATGMESMAIGKGARAAGQQSIVIGQNAVSEHHGGSIVIGQDAKASGDSEWHGVVVGSRAEVTGGSGVALGNDSKVTAGGGVALGFGSLADREWNVLGYTPDRNANSLQDRLAGTEYDKLVKKLAPLITEHNQLVDDFNHENDPIKKKEKHEKYEAWKAAHPDYNADVKKRDMLKSAWKSGGGAVSVGNSEINATRQIIGVAAGSKDTDAVNVAQLKALNKKVDDIGVIHYVSVNKERDIYYDKEYKTNYDNTGASAKHSVAVGYKAAATVEDGVALGSKATAAVTAGKIGYLPGSTDSTIDGVLEKLQLKEKYAELKAKIEPLQAEYKKKLDAFDEARKDPDTMDGEEEDYQKWVTDHPDFMAALKEFNAIESTWKSGASALSIGDKENGVTRQITNLAAGTEDTDAVNVAQLKVVNTKVDKNAKSITDLTQTVNNNSSAITELNKKITNTTSQSNWILGVGRGDDSETDADATAEGTETTINTGDRVTLQAGRGVKLKQNGTGVQIGLKFIDMDPAGFPFNDAKASAGGSLAIGQNSIADGHQSTAIGLDTSAKEYGFAAGTTSSAAKGAVAIGSRALASGEGSIAIGEGRRKVEDNPKQGYRKVDSNYAIAIGDETAVDKESVGSVVVGTQGNIEKSNFGSAYGYNATLENSNYATALGIGTKVINSNNGTALGVNSMVTKSDNGIALGNFASVDNSIAGLSVGSVAKVNNAIAGTAIGNNTVVKDAFGAVAIGFNSMANRQSATLGYNPSGEQWTDFNDFLVKTKQKDAYEQAVQENKHAEEALAADKDNAELREKVRKTSAAVRNIFNTWISTVGVVSIGNEEIGFTRQLTGVAAGTQDTDAVNVAQLKALATAPMGFDVGGKVENNVYTPGAKNWTMPLSGLRMSFGDGLLAEEVTDKDGKKYTLVKMNDEITIGKAGQDGKDGKIGINGKDGKFAEISVGKGKDGVDGKNGENGITRIIYKDDKGETRQVATLDDGLKFKGDNDGVVIRKLNTQLNIKGGATATDLSENNIGVVGTADADGQVGNLTVKLSKNLKGLTSAEFKDGDNITNITGDNISITKKVNNENKTVNLWDLSTTVEGNTTKLTTIEKNITNLTTKAGNKIHYLSIGPDNESNLARGGNYDNDGVEQHWGIAIGVDASSKDGDGIAMGKDSRSRGNESIGLGSLSSAVGNYSASVGHMSQAFGNSASAYGALARAYGANGVALGAGALVSNSKSLTKAEYDALPEEEKALYHIEARGQEEYYQYKQKTDSGEIKDIEVNGVAIGNFAKSIGIGGVAIGDHAKASDKDNIQNSAWGGALGAYSQNKVQQGVAIGTLSVADRAKDVKGYLPTLGKSIENFEEAMEATGKAEAFKQFKKEYVEATAKLNEAKTAYEANTTDDTLKRAFEQAKKKVDDLTAQYSVMTAPWTSRRGAVSIGNDKTGFTRQLTGLAAGSEDTDAVNVAQLKALNTKVDKGAIHYFSVKSAATGAGSNYNNDGAKKDGGIAIGKQASATGTSDIAIGTEAQATGGWGVAIGQAAKAKASTAVAMAYAAEAKGKSSLAIGIQSEAKTDNSTAYGREAKALGEVALAVGVQAKAEGDHSAVFGAEAVTDSTAWNGTAIGRGAYIGKQAADGTTPDTGVSNNYYTPVDDDMVVEAGKETMNSTAVGFGAKAFGYQNTALGSGAEAFDTNTVAVGVMSKAIGHYANALGKQARAEGKNSTAIGHFARALGESSMALGDYAITSTLDGKGKVNRSVALGSHARVTADNSLALGNNSLASIADDVKTEAYLSKEAFKKENGVVSVGNKAYTIDGQAIEENYRRIANIAGGADDHDAVNVAQLKALAAVPMNFYFGGVKDKNNVYTPGGTNWSMPLNEFHMDFGDGLKAEKVEKDGKIYTLVTLDKETLKNDPSFKGEKGDAGKDGINGTNGKSAFELWKEQKDDQDGQPNKDKTEKDFFDSLKGEKGTDGAAGKDGTNGTNGKSAYELWKEQSGNEGKSEQDFLNGLKGKDGAKGADGTNGKSAYELWKEQKNSDGSKPNENKSEEDFLKGLKGEKGTDGAAGKDGANGKSAFEIWKEQKDDHGNQPNKDKTEKDFFDSLKGKDGAPGTGGSGTAVEVKGDAKSGIKVTSDVADGKTTYTVGIGDSIKVGDRVTIDTTSATIGDVKIDGTENQGTITGLSNTKWDGQRIVSGRAATENQLQQATETIQHHMVEMGQRVDHVGAKSAALAALHPLDYDADDKWDFSAAVGNYNGASSVALGAFYRPNERTMISMGGTVGGEGNMVNLGVSLKTGSGVDGQVYTSRTAMAKEIKALKEKEAARDAVLQQMAEREAVKDAEITKLKEKDAQREEQLRKLIALVTAMQHK